MKNLPDGEFPLLPVRDIVIFPHMVTPLFVGRAASISALDSALASGDRIFLVAQKDSRTDNPSVDEIYPVGTISRILQVLRMPDGTVKALVEGEYRGRIVDADMSGDYCKATIKVLKSHFEYSVRLDAKVRLAMEIFQQYARSSEKIPMEVVRSVAAMTDPDRISDIMAAHLPAKVNEKQAVLEECNAEKRLERLYLVMTSESQITRLAEKIKGQVKKQMEKNQREYYLNEQIKAINKELGRDEGNRDGELDELERRIKKKRLPREAAAKVRQELKKLRLMAPMSAEATVVRNYIDWVLAIPWFEKTRDIEKLEDAEYILEKDHYGLEKPKERILEYLAVKKLSDSLKGPVLCFVGPPGVGKTSLAKSVARALGRNFVRLSLGGVRDEAEIRGHRRTYIGALPGKIIQSMKKSRSCNPVFCLDEVDKMNSDFRGDPASALLEVLDPEQNYAFNDHYLDLDYDLSNVLFITTANALHTIPLPLRDRMEIIELDSYAEEEKLEIAVNYLIPRQQEQHGLSSSDMLISTGAIRELTGSYTREAGVRNLERSIGAICRKTARKIVTSREISRPVRITRQSLGRLLGPARFRNGQAEKKSLTGVATGLAWTETGGTILQIEAVIMPGRGKLTITGKLGDVMQESARAAMSYVRSRSGQFGLPWNFYQKIDIHIHVPEGAIPKDGPSAGITIATVLVSSLLKVPVRHDVAMTGEITLRGRVLPIGGLKEKLLAARRAGIGIVLIPEDNMKDFREIPPRIIRGLDVRAVNHMDQVLELAMDMENPENLFKHDYIIEDKDWLFNQEPDKNGLICSG
jgi:ATP-dependent Lon protease